MTMYVMPNPGKLVNGEPVKVIDPMTGQFMAAVGKNVPSTPYWLRRVASRDVIRTTPAEAAARAAETPRTDDAKGEATGGAQDSALIAVINGLDRDDPAHFTKGGRPNLNVLAELMARRVTSEELDSALAAIEAGAATVAE